MNSNAGVVSALRGLVDLVFPPACQVCRARGPLPLCDACRSGFRLIRPPLCQKCGRPLHGPENLLFTCVPCRHRRRYYACARAAGIYDGALREAVHALKFGRHRALAEPLGRLMAEAAAREPRYRSADVIVPVPLHSRRLRARGFNQAELLARVVGETLRIPVGADLLARIRRTGAQVELTASERAANVRDAFMARGRIAGQRVLLVDDVISTGATASECARQLRQAGAGEVAILAAALALLD